MRDVADRHAIELASKFQTWLGDISNLAAMQQLRFLTVLHAVVPLDQDAARSAITAMEARLTDTLLGLGAGDAISVIAATEVEVVNFKLLNATQSQREDEKRKLTVLRGLQEEGGSLLPPLTRSCGSYALIHLHGLVNIKRDNTNHALEIKLSKALRSEWPNQYAVELKATIKNQDLSQKLKSLAKYMTKGGNDDLRYKTGFQRDLPGDLDGKMWRAGMGVRGRGGETVEDERGLKTGEISFLNEIIDWMIARNDVGNGYLIEI